MCSCRPGVMSSIGFHRSWLTLWLALVSSCAFPTQSTRNVDPPYQLSFNFNQIAGNAVTYGPGESVRGGKFYRTLTLHEGVIVVGGKSQLFSASPDTLNTLENVSIPATSIFKDVPCEGCDGNYIRVIQPLSDGSLLECGTNAISPYCLQRSAKNLSPIGNAHNFRRDDVAPSLPHQNSSWLLVKDKESNYQIFAGTNLVNTFGTLGEPAIVKASLDTSTTAIDISLKTKDNPNTVLNGPQFIGTPIEYGDRIYFFFREFASEHMNAGRIVYSRVAMVCKDELGGNPFTTYTDKQLVTFVKARLDCSIPGDFPYHYNEIQDIYQSTANPSVVYAVFATGPTGVASSAVCAYRLDEIENQFLKSRFKAQEDDMLQWLELLDDPVFPRQATCPDSTKNYTDTEYRTILTMAQLLHNSARNRLHYETWSAEDNRGRPARMTENRDSPLLVLNGERFTQIVVDEDVLNSIDVMFIGTENGTVLKAYLDESRTEARIVEEISLNAEGMKTPVLTMLKSDNDQAVFVGTDIGVFKIPFQHCQDYTTCRSCLDAKDPYCKWAGDSCTSNSTEGLQDLAGGSSDCMTDQNDGISIHTAPQDQRRSVSIADQPVNLYLVAEGPDVGGLRAVEINCDPCASLPFTQFKSPACSVGREVLVLHINGSSHEATNCTCSCEVEIGGVVKSVAKFNLTADNSAVVNASYSDLEELTMFDLSIAAYKYELKEWKNKVAEACDLTDLKACSSDRCS